MNKKELTAQVASKTGLTNLLSAKVVEAVFLTIRESFERNESTTIHEFGSFSVLQRAKRIGVNPSTKKQMTIPAHKVVKFNVSKKIELK